MDELDRGRLIERAQEYKRTGFPEKAQRIQVALNNDEFPDPQLMAGVDEVVTPLGSVMEMPNRSGKGSGLKLWKAFARDATDWDDDVIDSLTTRSEVIEILEANSVIPQLDTE